MADLDRIQSFYDFLTKISDRGMRRGLDRMAEAVALLNHPERKIKILHIAGTNGKGSACYNLAQLLAASGFRVGLAVSPHVDDYRERLQEVLPPVRQVLDEGVTKHCVTLQPVGWDALLATHDELVRKLPEELALTYFEWGILLAFAHFEREGFDYLVLETGLGGRWDASNVCQSIFAGITSIGLDHVAELGDSLEKILTEKLQIVKPGVDFLFGDQNPKLIEQARSHAQAVGAHYYHVDDDSAEWRPVLEQPIRSRRGWAPLRAAQQKNTMKRSLEFVLATGRILQKRGVPIDFESFFALDDFSVAPARYETISHAPLIIRDGAHNEPALLELRKSLQRDFQDDYDLVYGCVNDRDAKKLAKIVVSGNGRNFWPSFDAGSRSPNVSVIHDLAAHFGGSVVNLDRNFADDLRSRVPNRPLIVCGSFYLCSEFLKFWRNIYENCP